MRDPLAVRVCKMAHGGVVEDSANGDGQLEEFIPKIFRNQTNWHFVKEPSTFVLRVLTYTMLVVLQVSLQC